MLKINIRAYLEITRPINVFISSLGVILGMFIASGQIALTYIHLLAFLSVSFILIAGNIINDYFDLKIDRINRPYRPIPSGAISKKGALRLAVLFFFIGILISSNINASCTILAVFNSILLIVYNKIKKRNIFGNLIIAYLVSSIFLFSSLIVRVSSTIIYILMILAGLSTFSREITKDLEDKKGDEGNKITLPIKYGVDVSSTIAAISLFIAIILSLHPSLIALGKAYLYSIFFADAIFFYCAARLLYNREKYASELQRFEKVGMLIALFAFLIGVL